MAGCGRTHRPSRQPPNHLGRKRHIELRTRPPIPFRHRFRSARPPLEPPAGFGQHYPPVARRHAAGNPAPPGGGCRGERHCQYHRGRTTRKTAAITHHATTSRFLQTGRPWSKCDGRFRITLPDSVAKSRPLYRNKKRLPPLFWARLKNTGIIQYFVLPFAIMRGAYSLYFNMKRSPMHLPCPKGQRPTQTNPILPPQRAGFRPLTKFR